MKRNWSIIPTFEQKEVFAELAHKYQTAFEYNDFFLPHVYESEEEIERRICGYCSLDRNRSNDTLHGVFLDIVLSSDDKVIAEYSKKRMRQSMEIAQRLGIKGVVFHSGLVPGVTNDTYISNWLKRQEEFFRNLLKEFPSLHIYLENTLEQSATYLTRLKENLKDCERFCFCLDYAHATITNTSTKQWINDMGEYVRHLHINDNDGMDDLHQVPGEGNIDWKVFEEETERFQNATVLIEINGLEKQKKALEYLVQL